MTSKIQVMPSVTVVIKSHLGRDSGKDGEEGVTAEINKCAKCDSDSGQSRDMTSKIQVMPSVTEAMKSYLGHDSGNDGEEGVTSEINKCAECDSDDKQLP